MAATTYYVDTDVVGGSANGTSWANAFSTLAAAENALDKDLDTANEQMTIICSGDAEDTTAVPITGWTMTPGDGSLTIQAANETDHFDRAVSTGISASKYTLHVTDNQCITVQENNVTLDGLQIKSTYASDTWEDCIWVSAVDASNKTTVKNCYIHADGATYRGFLLEDADGITEIYNCIVIGGSYGIYIYSGVSAAIYNCTIYQGTYGIDQDAGTVTIKNCAVLNTATADITGTMTVDHCASDDGYAGETNAVAESGGGADWPSDFVDGSAGDFTLLSTSNLVNAGVDDPGSGLYDDDINGETRTSTWDVGADEYVAAAGGANYIPAIYHYQRMRVA